MTDYLKVTDFATKDGLSTGNPLKIISGTEIDTEFNSIETAIGTKADLISPTFSGVPIAPTAAAGTGTTQIATCGFVTNSVQLQGTPTAPTATTGTATTQIATCSFVTNEIASTVIDGFSSPSADVTLNSVLVNSLYLNQNTTGWRIYQSGTDLKFAYNGIDRLKLSSAGALVVEGDVTAYGAA